MSKAHVSILTALFMGISLVPTASFAQSAPVGTSFIKEHQSFFYLLDPDGSDLEFSYLHQPSNDEDAGEGSFDLSQLDVGFELPLPVTQDFYFRFGADYQMKTLDFDNPEGARIAVSSESLHKIAMKGGLGYFVSPDFLLTGIASLGSYSDLDSSFDSEWMKLYGRVEGVYRFNPHTQLLAGLSASPDLEDEDIFPFVGLRLMSTGGKLHIDVTVPLDAQVTYGFTPQLQGYVGAWLSGNEFEVSMSDEKFPVYVQDTRVGVGVKYWLSNHIALGFEAGASVDSKLKFKVSNPGQFEDSDLEEAAYAGFNVGFSL